MYRDQPQDRVHTLGRLIFTAHTPRLGSRGTRRGRARDRRIVSAIQQRGYAPSRTVSRLAGPLRADEAISAVDEALGGLAAP